MHQDKEIINIWITLSETCAICIMDSLLWGHWCPRISQCWWYPCPWLEHDEGEQAYRKEWHSRSDYLSTFHMMDRMGVITMKNCTAWLNLTCRCVECREEACSKHKLVDYDTEDSSKACADEQAPSQVKNEGAPQWNSCFISLWWTDWLLDFWHLI